MMTTPDQLHVARSQFIDAFASVETAICNLIRVNGSGAKPELLALKLKALKEIEPSSQYSKAKRAEVLKVLEDFESYLAIRADIVHGTLQVLEIDGSPAATFINAKTAREIAPAIRIIDPKLFGTMTTALTKIARQLSKSPEINPASSPLPPSPAAAGGP